jgi:hypothetical protein
VRLVVELESDRYAQAESGELSVLAASLREIEVRQADGLFSFVRRVRLVEQLSGQVATQLGVDEAPAIRVYMGPEEDA